MIWLLLLFLFLFLFIVKRKEYYAEFDDSEFVNYVPEHEHYAYNYFNPYYMISDEYKSEITEPPKLDKRIASYVASDINTLHNVNNQLKYNQPSHFFTFNQRLKNKDEKKMTVKKEISSFKMLFEKLKTYDENGVNQIELNIEQFLKNTTLSFEDSRVLYNSIIGELNIFKLHDIIENNASKRFLILKQIDLLKQELYTILHERFPNRT